MILCGGLSVCGASASTAVQSVIGGTSEELTLSISIISIFTIIQMIAIPYIALAMQFLARSVIAAALGGMCCFVFLQMAIFFLCVCMTPSPTPQVAPRGRSMQPNGWTIRMKIFELPSFHAP